MIVWTARCCCGRFRCVYLAFVIGLLFAASLHAQEPDPMRDYTLPATSLVKTVNAISQQSGIQMIYDAALLKGKQAAAISGHLTGRQALDKALAGTGLIYEFVNGDTIVIRKAAASSTKPGDNIQPPNKSSASASHANTTTLSAVTVTGTRIRGGMTASPTITIDQIDFQQQGFADLGEVIRDIPQNYRGGQNPGVTPNPNGLDIINEDITGGSALDLRGFGPDATLTLLNGRRLSYDGFGQAVDIGAIPIAAVDKLELVPDGASAIYGSDAVAGVANVILKRDFDGVTLGTRYGSTADGGMMSHEYDATAGTTWNSGGLIATFEKEDQSPIYADQRPYTQYMLEPQTIYPGSTLKSGLLSLHQSLGDAAEFTLDMLSTVRTETNLDGNPGYYYQSDSKTSELLIAPGLKFFLPGDWTLSTDVTRGRDSSTYTDNQITPGAPTVTDTGCFCNQSWSGEIGGEGPLFHVNDNEARLAVGMGARGNRFRTNEDGSNGEARSDEERFAYAELAIPFVSSQNAQPGLYRLELTVAGRAEDYNSFGHVATPKVGIIYDPTPDISLKSSWGRSFKAPTLEQRYAGRISYLWDADQVGGSGYPPGSTLLMSYGGNPDLKPEHANTLSVSVDVHPEAMPGLDVELTYFNIDYTERVAQPLIYLTESLSNPAYAQFITYNPTLQQQQQLLKQYNDAFFNFSSSGIYDPSKVIAIANDQYINAYQQHASGLDLDGSYKIKLAASQLTLSGAASWLRSSQRNGMDVPSFDLSGTLFHPAKLNGRFGAVWKLGEFSASGFMNYTAGVMNPLAPMMTKTSSFTTFDSTVVYQTPAGHAVFDGLVVSLSVQNLLNRKPPLFVPPTIAFAPYDPTNYSAIGRYVNVSLSKHW